MPLRSSPPCQKKLSDGFLEASAEGWAWPVKASAVTVPFGGWAFACVEEAWGCEALELALSFSESPSAFALVTEEGLGPTLTFVGE